MTPRTLRILAGLLVLAAGPGVAEVPDSPTEVRHVTTERIVEDPSLLPANGLLTTGQPDIAVLDAAAAAGFSTVIDFRGADEERGIDERAEVESRGMHYVSIPVGGAEDITFETAAVLGQALSEADGPVLLHCVSGNRAAAVLALRESQNGADSEAALALGLEAGLTRHRTVVEERLAEGQ